MAREVKEKADAEAKAQAATAERAEEAIEKLAAPTVWKPKQTQSPLQSPRNKPLPGRRATPQRTFSRANLAKAKATATGVAGGKPLALPAKIFAPPPSQEEQTGHEKKSSGDATKTGEDVETKASEAAPVCEASYLKQEEATMRATVEELACSSKQSGEYNVQKSTVVTAATEFASVEKESYDDILSPEQRSAHRQSGTPGVGRRRTTPRRHDHDSEHDIARSAKMIAKNNRPRSKVQTPARSLGSSIEPMVTGRQQRMAPSLMTMQENKKTFPSTPKLTTSPREQFVKTANRESSESWDAATVLKTIKASCNPQGKSDDNADKLLEGDDEDTAVTQAKQDMPSFDEADTNGDGFITQREYEAANSKEGPAVATAPPMASYSRTPVTQVTRTRGGRCVVKTPQSKAKTVVRSSSTTKRAPVKDETVDAGYDEFTMMDDEEAARVATTRRSSSRSKRARTPAAKVPIKTTVPKLDLSAMNRDTTGLPSAVPAMSKATVVEESTPIEAGGDQDRAKTIKETVKALTERCALTSKALFMAAAGSEPCISPCIKMTQIQIQTTVLERSLPPGAATKVDSVDRSKTVFQKDMSLSPTSLTEASLTARSPTTAVSAVPPFQNDKQPEQSWPQQEKKAPVDTEPAATTAQPAQSKIFHAMAILQATSRVQSIFIGHQARTTVRELLKFKSSSELAAVVAQEAASHTTSTTETQRPEPEKLAASPTTTAEEHAAAVKSQSYFYEQYREKYGRSNSLAGNSIERTGQESGTPSEVQAQGQQKESRFTLQDSQTPVRTQGEGGKATLATPPFSASHQRDASSDSRNSLSKSSVSSISEDMSEASFHMSPSSSRSPAGGSKGQTMGSEEQGSFVGLRCSPSTSTDSYRTTTGEQSQDKTASPQRECNKTEMKEEHASERREAAVVFEEDASTAVSQACSSNANCTPTHQQEATPHCRDGFESSMEPSQTPRPEHPPTPQKDAKSDTGEKKSTPPPVEASFSPRRGLSESSRCLSPSSDKSREEAKARLEAWRKSRADTKQQVEPDQQPSQGPRVAQAPQVESPKPSPPGEKHAVSDPVTEEDSVSNPSDGLVPESPVMPSVPSVSLIKEENPSKTEGEATSTPREAEPKEKPNLREESTASPVEEATVIPPKKDPVLTSVLSEAKAALKRMETVGETHMPSLSPREKPRMSPREYKEAKKPEPVQPTTKADPMATDSPVPEVPDPAEELSAAGLLRRMSKDREKQKESKAKGQKPEVPLAQRLWEEQEQRMKQRYDETSKARETELKKQKEKLAQMQQQQERDSEREREFARKENRRAEDKQKQQEQRAYAAAGRQNLRDRINKKRAEAAESAARERRSSLSPSVKPRVRKTSTSVEQDEAEWEKFAKSPPDQIRLADIPFPSIFSLSLTRRPMNQRKKIFRDLAKRWHPDKVMNELAQPPSLMTPLLTPFALLLPAVYAALWIKDPPRREGRG